MVMYTGLTLRACQNIIVRNKKGSVVGRDGATPPLSLRRRIPPGILLRDPSHLSRQEVLTLWDFLASRQRMAMFGLIFLL